MIECTDQLTTKQQQDLEQLLAICKKTDDSIPNVYLHILCQKRMLPTALLYYKDERLVGFLSVYFFYEDAVEIALLVDPSVRGQGIAHQLIRRIAPLIEYQNQQKLIFSSPSHLNDQWLLAKGFSYLHSEYYMQRELLSPILENHSLVVRPASLEDIDLLSSIDEVCFPNHQSNLLERFQNLFEERNYSILIAYENQHPIGKAHIRWQAEGASLSDIAILPEKQGKGLGSALIAYCINLALSEGKPQLNLDVETHNLKALNLYTRLGFLIQNACDYWSINLKQLVP